MNILLLVKKKRFANDKTSMPLETSKSDDFGDSEIQFLISNLTSTNLTFLHKIVITITKLAAFTKNHVCSFISCFLMIFTLFN